MKESLEDPEFKRIWEDSRLEYELASQIIGKRIKKNISQRTLAKKVKTTQAVLSRIETMSANPSLLLLKRIASALDAKLSIQLK